MTTGSQDRNFAEMMQGEVEEVKVSGSALDSAIDWIKSNLNPDDVFDESDLEAWAEANGYVKE